MADEKIIARFTADISEYKAKLVELENQLNKVNDEQKKGAEEEKKRSAELATASQKRKAALQNEEAELKRLQAALKQAFTVKDIETFNQKIAQSKANISVLKGEVGGIGKIAGGLGSQFAALGAGIAAAFTVTGIINFATEARKVASEFESLRTTLNFMNGSAEAGGQALSFLTSLTNQLGLDLESTARSFKLFSASSQLAGISSKETQEIFKSVSIAVSSLGLSADDANGVFLALSQIISKGTVSAEELRGQIGERLPGAFEIAAKAIGVSTKELNKLLEGGKIGAKQFLPVFANELKNTFQGALPQSVDSARANLNRLQNTITQVKVNIGDAVNRMLNDFIRLFGGLKEQEVNPLKQLNAEFNIQIETLKRGNLSQENRKQLIDDINKKYGEYLPNLLTEKTSLEEIDKAQQAVNKSMLGRILLQEQEKELAKIIKNAADANRDLINIELERTKSQKQLGDNAAAASLKQEQLNQRELLAREIIKNSEKDIAKLSNEYNRLAEALGIAADKKKSFDFGPDEKAIKEAEKQRIKLQKELDGIAANNIQNRDKQILDLKGDLRKQSDAKLKEIEDAADREVEINNRKNREISEADRLARERQIAENKNKLKIQEEQNELIKQKAVSLANDIADSIFAVEKQNLARRQQAELESLEKQKDKALASKRLTEKERENIEKQFAIRAQQLKKKQFEETKRLALTEAIIKGALAVVAALAQGGPFAYILAAATAAAVAVEVATISAQKYAKGTKKAKGGMAMVGEEGPEFMYVPNQAKILTAKQTRQHSNIIDAIYDNRLEKLIYQDHILPALEKQKSDFNKRKEQSFADNLSRSLIFQGLTGKEMDKIRRKGTAITNTDELAEKIAAIISKGFDRRRMI